MYRGADGNMYYSSEQEKREMEGTVAQVYIYVLLVMGVLFLIVCCITCYCYKKKRVTPGFVIQPPPTAVSVAAPGPTYPAGTPVYPPGTAHHAGIAVYPPGTAHQAGTTVYPPGGPANPSETGGYPTTKREGPPPYTPVTQTHF